ncbi:MAG: hypothetical protein JWR67_768 [Mucilaginibacter sp.]|nr:hypothetical protein [Mucilaginibacter sp.]MDB5109654.1 hypothetical protein [Mucilaginibacter sp.]
MATINISKIKNTYGTETALIILCCRLYFKTAALNELEIFVEDNDIDWKRFVYLSGIHRIRPIVYKAVFDVNIPAEIKLLLSNEHAETIRLNWKQGIETERIILLLNKNNIEAVPYKGTAFSKQFYNDFVSRESNDIDLVINPEHLPLAIQILKKDGYIPEAEDVYQYLGSRYFNYYKDYNLNKFKGRIRDYHLELHWAIAENYFNVNPKVNSFIYTYSGQTAFFRSSIKTLDPVAHFSAMLIHHAIKDGFTSLKNIVDISQAIQQPCIQTQVSLLKKTFTNLEMKKVVSISNILSQQLMGVSLTELDDPEIADSTTQHFIDNICSSRLLLTDKKLFVSIKNALLLQDSNIKKLKFFYKIAKLRFIPATTDFRLIKLPKALFFVYYLIKPFRSIIKPINFIEEKRKLIPEN